MTKRQSRFTQIYFSGGVHYVRLCPVETQIFPHGIALATTFASKKEAEDFADKVDEYIEAMLLMSAGVGNE